MGVCTLSQLLSPHFCWGSSGHQMPLLPAGQRAYSVVVKRTLGNKTVLSLNLTALKILFRPGSMWRQRKDIFSHSIFYSFIWLCSCTWDMSGSWYVLFHDLPTGWRQREILRELGKPSLTCEIEYLELNWTFNVIFHINTSVPVKKITVT